MAYLNTDNGVEIDEKVHQGDPKFKLIRDALCYQIAKEIGACATVLEGKVDAIFLTGGLAYGEELTDEIKKRVSFIAPVFVLPGENEMEALSQGAINVLKGLEEANEY